MELNILLMPLLGGYICIKKSTLFKFKSIRYHTQELLLSSAVAGFLGLMIAYTVILILYAFNPELHTWWHSFVDFSYSGTAFLSFIGLLLFTYIPNFFINENEQIKEIIREDNDGIELIMLKALEEGKLVSTTLKNEKVYVGFISRHFFNPTSELKSIKLIPVFSGYRNSDDHRITFTTPYETVISYVVESTDHNLDIDDFQIGLPISEITSINIFDFQVYDMFNSVDPDQLSFGFK